VVNLAENKDDLIVRVEELQKKGFSDSQVYEALKKDGFTSVDIDDAVNQSKLGNTNQVYSQENIEEEAPEPGLRPSLLDGSEKENSRLRIMPETENINQFNIGNFQGARGNLSDVEALIESVIEEKWKTTIERFGNLDVWKEKVRTDVSSIKQELIRLEHRFGNIENAILGKISQYDRNIVNINNEMKVLEQVFQKIMTPLTTNIKELSKITKELKEK